MKLVEPSTDLSAWHHDLGGLWGRGRDTSKDRDLLEHIFQWALWAFGACIIPAHSKLGLSSCFPCLV